MDEREILNLEFYRGRRVFITGHTGFKGSWMCHLLHGIGAQVTGYALDPPTDPSLFGIVKLVGRVESIIGDVCDLSKLQAAINKAQPEIVIHMAAQPIVRESYNDPVGTYATNVMGTVNLLEAVRHCDSVRSVVNVTTDKVYENKEWEWGYREIDNLNGYDPYSNSKSCSELVMSSYINAFFKETNVAVSSCRAGNVIGGGDFAADRIIPDCVRAMKGNEKIIIRNPYSTRPYQHVLEPVCAYLMIAQQQYKNKDQYQGCYNIGPDDSDCVTTGNLADMFCDSWGEGSAWVNVAQKNAPHEANYLKLDCSKAKKILGWSPRWSIKQAIDKTIQWSKAYLHGEDIGTICKIMDKQIAAYLGDQV